VNGPRIFDTWRLFVRPSVLVLIFTVCLVDAPLFGAPPADDPLGAVLARMDQTAATFKGLKADIKKVAHTEVINVDDIDVGTIMVKRGVRSRDLHMLVEFKQPEVKKLLVVGTKAQLYLLKNPNEVQEYDLTRKFRGMFDQFLLLGFGSNSRDLRDAYTLKLGQPASETIGGEKTTKIELIPKSQEMLSTLKKSELWISDSKGIAVQQKMYTGGGDYILATYTNMAVNPSLPDLKLDLPRGVKISKPLKN
jgi:outer membrane lipoprotein-sorting protein